jgi:predicted transposase/invertase (TIGR01784 family)
MNCFPSTEQFSIAAILISHYYWRVSAGGIDMSITRYLDPKNDLAFKKVFGTEKNKDILIGFLNDMLGKSGEDTIKEVLFINPSQLPLLMGKKLNIIDVLCTDEKGVQYIVEMQVAQVDNFDKRAQFYTAKAYANQLPEGAGYSTLKKVIFLGILNFDMFPNLPRYRTNHVIVEEMSQVSYLKDLAFTFIELPKFTKGIDELETNQEKWCYFFKNTSDPENIEKFIKDSPFVIKRAYKELAAYNWPESELAAYEVIKKFELDNMAREDFLRKEGREEGREEGKKEAMASVAREMLISGTAIEQVMKLTGFSQEEVEQLRKSLQ